MYLKEYMMIVVGCILMAIGTSLFLLPNQLSSGGFAGIATIIYYLFKFPLGIVMACFKYTIIYNCFCSSWKRNYDKGNIWNSKVITFIDIVDKYKPLTEDRILACVYGGIFMGIGTAVVLKANASTGGTDMLSYIIRSFFPHFRSANLIVVIDIVIVLLNVLAFREVEIGLYSAIAIYIMGKMIDIIFEGVYFTKSMFIVSNKYKEIANEIGKKLCRGSTAIYAKGMYSKEKKMMLWCVGSRTETAKIKEIAKEIDPSAFIVISNAREAWGKGFK